MAITKQAPRRVHLSGRGETVNDIVASEAITPGHLVLLFNDGGTAKYRKHNVAGGNAAKTFALDQSELNKGIDDACAGGDLIPVFHATPGAVINALLPAAAAAVVAGDFLESNGDGTLRKHVAQAINEGGAANVTILPSRIVAIAKENVDNSAGGAAVRIRAEVI